MRRARDGGAVAQQRQPRRHGGPRRNIKPRSKLRAKKDTRRKAPRKTLAKKYGPFEEKPRRVEEGRL